MTVSAQPTTAAPDARAAAPTLRTEHVGSLLRPPQLLAAREARTHGDLDDEGLRQVEDEAILAALDLQRRAGVDVLTDGEFRRGWFGENLNRAVEGVAAGPARDNGRRWVGAGNQVSQTAEEVNKTIVAPGISYTAVGQVRAAKRINAHEATFVREHLRPGEVFKVTTMAPAAYTEGWFVPGAAPQYARGVDLLADVAVLLRDELVALAGEGVPYLQVDSLSYILRFGDEGETARFLSILGVGQDEAIDALLAADNLILDAAREAGAITSVHMCRGNSRSAWNAKAGTYDVATRALAGLHVDRLLLEYDTERAGTFDALAAVPEQTVVVLGLVTSKFGELERREDLLRRIEEAGRFHPVDRLALSPQCGFASTAPGNLLTHDDQQRKLELIVQVADEVWG